MSYYEYSNSADFPDGFTADKLQSEIDADPGISPNTLRIETVNDQFFVVFDATLTAGEKTILDGLVAAHIPDPLVERVYLERDMGADIITAQLSSGSAYFPAQYSQTVYISQEEKSGQYTTIRAALDANPTPNTIFLVHPGTYIENNPLVLPVSCLLVGAGTTAQITIVAANPASNLIVMNPWSKVDSMIITGATSACGIYFDGSVPPTSAYALFEECIITNCDTLVRAENGPNTLLGYRSLVSAS